jgi:hypothetical protein
MISSERFQEFLRKQPFVPFRVVMSSGKEYAVRHPELVFLTRGHAWIGMRPDDKGIPEDAELCSLLHVTAIEPIRNGSHRTGGRKRAR